MAFHLTHRSLVGMYELLLVTPPFSGWHLPPADDVVFEALPIDRPGRHGSQGSYCWVKKRHVIRVNPSKHSSILSAIMTLAHEVCHLRDQLNGVKSDHGKSFQKMADTVCNKLGFDRGQF
jgi:SprT-like family